MNSSPAFLAKFLGQSDHNSSLLVASAVVASAVVGTIVFSFLNSDTKIDESEEPFLSETEAIAIMGEFVNKAQLSGQKLQEHANQFRQQAASQGQQIDEAQLLKAFLFPHFEGILVELNNHVLQEHDLDEEELKHAVNYYMKEGSPKLKQICDKLNKLYKEFGGELEDEHEGEANFLSKSGISLDVPAGGVSKHKLLEVFTELMQAIGEHANEFLINFKMLHGSEVGADTMPLLQQGFMEIQQKASTEAFAACGVSETEFHAGVEKFHMYPEVQQAMLVMQEIIPRIMAAHGVRMDQ